jgi:hypothetical protein
MDDNAPGERIIMWPFSRVAQRRQLRAAFSKYLSPEFVGQIEKGSAGLLSTRPKPARICFILLQVRDDELVKAASDLSIATDTIIEHGGLVMETMGSCVLAIFGHSVGADPGQDHIQRDTAAAHLVANLSESIRLVYGDADGLVGNIGSQRRLHYGCLIPQFDEYLSAVFVLEFGKVARI